MFNHRRILLGVLAAVALIGVAGSLFPSAAQAPKAPAEPAKAEAPELAAVRKTAAAFTRAFDAGDAKAVAAFWTKTGEYTGPDGETIRGREEIARSYADFFQKHPKATIEVDIQSVRLVGRSTAVEEGTLKLRLPGESEPGISRYSVLHVREDDGWRMASVREWVPDPAELITLKDVDWLLGEWSARGEGGELHITYTWDEDKAFLRGRYTLKKADKVVSSGTQIIGKNATGGLRSWLFDSSGTYGEAVWSRDEDRWVMEAQGTLPDGSEVTATNILIPLGKDAFTWQSVDRTAAGSPLPDQPPLRVTRVKAGK